MRESNSHQRFWRPLSYHLTNPLYSDVVVKVLTTVVIIHKHFEFVKRRWRDLNPRTGCPVYRISSADPSATWVHLLGDKYTTVILYPLLQKRSIIFLLT